jgi:hypothetical protein
VKLLRAAVLLLVFATAAYDAGSVAWTSLTVQTAAEESAAAAATEWQQSHDAAAAYRAATERAARDHLVIAPSAFSVQADGTVRVEIAAEARTLVAHRIGPLRPHLRVTGHGMGRALL